MNFKYVPHKAEARAAKSILGGRVDVLVDPNGSILNYGLKPLVVLNGTRLDSVPDVPTIDEVGGAPLCNSIWFGLFAPAGSSKEIPTRLDEACQQGTATVRYAALLSKTSLRH